MRLSTTAKVIRTWTAKQVGLSSSPTLDIDSSFPHSFYHKISVHFCQSSVILPLWMNHTWKKKKKNYTFNSWDFWEHSHADITYFLYGHA